MATVTGLTAARMLEIEDASVVDGAVNGSGNLILTTHGGGTIDAGNVIGPEGPPGGSAAGVGDVARIMKQANQDIPNTTETIVTWLGTAASPYSDYTLWFDHTAGTLTLKPGMDGVYEITAFLYWSSAGAAGTRRIIAIDKAAASGGTFYRTIRNDGIAKATSSAASGVQVTATIPFVAGNQFRVIAYQDTGSALGQSAMSSPDGSSYGYLDISRRK